MQLGEYSDGISVNVKAVKNFPLHTSLTDAVHFVFLASPANHYPLLRRLMFVKVGYFYEANLLTRMWPHFTQLNVVLGTAYLP